MTEVEKCETTNRDLEAKRAACVKRGTDLADERANVALAAHTGNVKARKRLDEINATIATHGSELVSLDAAIKAAGESLKKAEAAAALEADRKLAGEARVIVDRIESLFASADLQPRFADAVPAEKPVGWHLPVGSTHRPCCGPGYLLVGDAAGLVDPFTGEGIANAMYSGRLAAQAAAMALRTGEAGAANLDHFDVALWDELGEGLKLSTRLQKIARLEWLLNFTIRKAARSQEVRDTLCAMIAQEVSREQMISPLFYLRLLVK